MAVVLPEMQEYQARRLVVADHFNQLPRGARTEASFDLRIATTLVSSVLSGRYIDERILARLKEWATVHTVPVKELQGV